MARVLDVAQYILQQKGPMTAMKLQKLVYYSQAWHIVWEDDILFPEQIQAWANGPVVVDLFKAHQGKFRLSEIDGASSDGLTESEKSTVDKVLGFYGDQSSQWLSDLTHMEDPWKFARIGVPNGASCQNEITPDSLSTYYSSL